jgi:hypothetical protein
MHMPSYEHLLNPERAFIFRITHITNIPWILENGLCCQNSATQDPRFIGIGNSDLIRKRTDRVVPIEPRGNLCDYIPFYFTPFSPIFPHVLQYPYRMGWATAL